MPNLPWSEPKESPQLAPNAVYRSYLPVIINQFAARHFNDGVRQMSGLVALP
ncbi:MAG: hypothetical protein R3E31_14370 [Chloroflexota bacterium]